MWPFSFSACFDKKIEITVLIFFPLNIYGTSFWNLLFGWLLLEIISPGSKRNFQGHKTLEGDLSGTFGTHHTHPLSTKCSSNLFLKLIPFLIVVGNNCPSLYENITVEFVGTYIIGRWNFGSFCASFCWLLLLII